MRHRRLAPEQTRGQASLRHVDELARREAPVGVGGALAQQRRLLARAALQVLEHEARHAPMRDGAQILDGDRARQVAPGVVAPPGRAVELGDGTIAVGVGHAAEDFDGETGSNLRCRVPARAGGAGRPAGDAELIGQACLRRYQAWSATPCVRFACRKRDAWTCIVDVPKASPAERRRATAATPRPRAVGARCVRPPNDPSVEDPQVVARALDTDLGTAWRRRRRRAGSRATDRTNCAPPPARPLWRRLLAQFQDPLVYLLLAAVGGLPRGLGRRRRATAGRSTRSSSPSWWCSTRVLGYVQEATRGERRRRARPHDGGHLGGAARRRRATRSERRAGPRRRARARRRRRGRRRCAAAARRRAARAGGFAHRRERGGAEGRRTLRTARAARRSASTWSSRAPPSRRAPAAPSSPRPAWRPRWAPSPTCSTRPREEPTPLQKEVARIGRMLGIAVVVIAVVVVGDGPGCSRRSDSARRRRHGAAARRLARGRRRSRGPARRSCRSCSRSACSAWRAATRDRQEAVVGRDARLGLGHLLRQDRHADALRDDDPARRHGLGQQPTSPASATRRTAGVEHEGERADRRAAARRARRRAERRQPGRATPTCAQGTSGDWEIQGDPTEAAFLVAERKLGATERRRRRFERVARDPVQLRPQDDVDDRARPRAGRRAGRRHQGRARRADRRAARACASAWTWCRSTRRCARARSPTWTALGRRRCARSRVAYRPLASGRGCRRPPRRSSAT